MLIDKKALFFALAGLIGGLLAAILGESVLTLTRPVAPAQLTCLALDSSPSMFGISKAQHVALLLDSSPSMFGIDRSQAICLAFDCSNSMFDPARLPPGVTTLKIDEVREAARGFVESQNSAENRLALVAFGSTAETRVPLMHEREPLLNALREFRPMDGTAHNVALEEARRALDGAKEQRTVLLFTDGQPMIPGITPEAAQELALKQADVLRGEGIRIIAVATTSDTDRAFLDRLTGDHNNVFQADPGRLAQAFQQAEQALTPAGTQRTLNPRKMNEVKEAARKFIGLRDLTEDRLAVVGFGGTARTACPLTGDEHRLETALDSLSQPIDYTRLDTAIEAGVQLLHDRSAPRYILLFTDGLPDDPSLARDEAARRAIAAAQRARQQGIKIITVATSDAPTGFLTDLTGNRSKVFPTEVGQFDRDFQRAEKAISEDGQPVATDPRKMNEVKAAAIAFVHKPHAPQDRMAVVSFGGTARTVVPLSRDSQALQIGIRDLKPIDNTRPDLALDEATRQLAATKGRRGILLFTDGLPDDPALARSDAARLAVTAAERARAQGIQIVAVATPDADPRKEFLGQITGDPARVFSAEVGQFGEAFGKAERTLAELVGTGAEGKESSLLHALLRNAAWTAVLAMGIGVALQLGQSRYLRRRPSRGSVMTALGGGLLAGGVAGVAGQLLMVSLGSGGAEGGGHAAFGAALVQRGVAWGLLGALIGSGLSLCIPNLSLGRAAFGGVVGGAVGALVFQITVGAAAPVVARLAGAAILGLCIGLMIALAEAVLREVWLVVHYGAGESRTVGLGREVVSLGSDAAQCTLYAAGALPVALRYWLDGGKVFCAPGAAVGGMVVSPGDRRRVGALEVEVCAAGNRAAGTASPPPVPAPYTLVLGPGKQIPLALGTQVLARDIPALKPAPRSRSLATVTSHPQDPGRLGLLNQSTGTWSARLPSGESRTVEPGKSLRLVSGTRIDFGSVQAEVR